MQNDFGGNQSTQTQSAPLQKNWLEWIVFALGALLVAGVLGYLAYAAATLGDTPPKLKITLGKVQPEGAYFRVPIEVRNDGDQTAEGVEVEVLLARNGKEIETGRFEAAFLPRHSKRSGAVLFKADPRAGRLNARVLGYEEP